MRIRFPIAAVTDLQIMEYLYIAQEALRIEHNFQSGELGEIEFQDWWNKVFLPRSCAIGEEIAKYRVFPPPLGTGATPEEQMANMDIKATKALMKASTRYAFDLVDDFY